MGTTTSIICNAKECYICGSQRNLQRHHTLHGISNRKNAEKYGLWVYLCTEHHTGTHGAHQDRALDIQLIKISQKAFEREYGSRSEFIRVFGKSYLED